MGLLDRMDRHNQEIAERDRAHPEPPEKGGWAWIGGAVAALAGIVGTNLIGAWGILAIPLAVLVVASAVGFLRRR